MKLAKKNDDKGKENCQSSCKTFGSYQKQSKDCKNCKADKQKCITETQKLATKAKTTKKVEKKKRDKNNFIVGSVQSIVVAYCSLICRTMAQIKTHVAEKTGKSNSHYDLFNKRLIPAKIAGRTKNSKLFYIVGSKAETVALKRETEKTAELKDKAKAKADKAKKTAATVKPAGKKKVAVRAAKTAEKTA